MEPMNSAPMVHQARVPTLSGCTAHVPAPLPAAFDWTTDLVGELGRAERMIGRLQGVMRDLHNPRLVIRPLLAREAVMSSQIEGTQAGLDELYRDRVDQDAHHPANMQQWLGELRNADAALRQAMKLRHELPVSKQMWLQLHRTLMQGVRGGQADPGAFRRLQNWIGPPGCTIQQATYIPPPPQLVLDCLSELERFIHQPSDLPPLVRLAMIHYQFEAIHPFIDGNGRVGRLINTLLMAEWDILVAPPIDLSTYLKRHQAQYYRLLLAVSREGAWGEWIAFFLRGLGEQAGDAYARGKRLVALRRRYLKMLRMDKQPASMVQLVDRLFLSPYITANHIAEKLRITPATARKQVMRLEAMGIVREITGQKRNRIYLATEVFSTIQDDIPNYDEGPPSPGPSAG